MRALYVRLASTPERLLAGLFLVCLAIFLAALPLPRVDQHLIGSDGAFYYAYLPSLFLDGDLDFANQYHLSLAPDHPALTVVSPTGLTPNAYAIGSAFLWAPFFLLAHGLVLGLNALGMALPANGYGNLYEALTLIGSMSYGFVALMGQYRLARRWVTARAALPAVLLLWWGTNVIYYMVVEPSMSHMAAMFAVTLFITLWLDGRDRPTWRRWLALGAAGGLVALVRLPDATIWTLPFLDALSQLRSWSDLKPWAVRWGVFLLGALVVFTPQIVAWQVMYGNPLYSGYQYGSAHPLFYWSRPQLLNVLFSTQHGLFLWHPLFLAACVGLIFLARREPRLTLWLVVGLFLQLYVVSAWWDWTQGDAFGGRMFISVLPIFTLGLAALVEALMRARATRWLAWGAGALVLWNGLFMIQYRFGFIPMTGALTFEQLVIGKFTLPFQLLARWRR